MAFPLVTLDAVAHELARRSFWDFFLYMDPGVTPGWWQRDAADHLQRFYECLIEGARPKLAITAPPQHGKSRLIVDFLAWLAGQDPDRKIVYTSFSDQLGVRANLRMQRMLDSPRYQAVFPGTRLSMANVVTQSAKPRRHSAMLEFVGRGGYFRNTTVRGAITGEGFDLGVIDDPIKGREEAESQTIRDKTWDWLNDDLFTRFSERSGLLAIMTRWHLDDPIGRLAEHDPELEVVAYRAVAEEDERPHRRAGEALFPEFKSLDFLNEQRARMHPASWLSLYQQRPIPREGGIIKESWLTKRYRERGAAPRRVFQSWDCASKAKDRNDPSVCGTFAEFDDRVELWHVDVGRREFPELVRRAKDIFADVSVRGPAAPHAVVIEDKDAGQQLIQQLRADTKLPVVACDPRGLDKETRMMTESPFIEAGKLWLPDEAPWLATYVAEITTFPQAAHDDQADMTSQALKWRRENPIFIGAGVRGVKKESNRLR